MEGLADAYGHDTYLESVCFLAGYCTLGLARIVELHQDGSMEHEVWTFSNILWKKPWI